MHELAALHDALVQANVFQEWYREHPNAYLCSFFQIGNGGQEGWQVDYYDKAADEMTAFAISRDAKSVALNEANSKVFKEAGQVVDELRLEKVQVPLSDAMTTAEETAGKYYPGEVVAKKIIILQRIEREQFNITFLTTSLCTINVRINAANGEVLSHTRDAIGMQLRK